MGWMDFLKPKNKAVTVSKYQLITDQGGGFYAWNGNLYKSDIVRSAIRPKVQAIGKAVAKHIRENDQGTKVNPDVYMRFLLEEPNIYMTGQQMQEKLTTHLELNNNAFAFINRDENGYPTELYPITATTCEVLQDDRGTLFMRFTLRTGKTVTFRHEDVLHLKKDYNENEFFGDSPAEALTPLMEVVSTTDQGIVKAIRNASAIKWLLKFNSNLRPEDLKQSTTDFVKTYLDIDSEVGGAAATDAKFDAKQVDPKDYVPNDKQMDKTTERIYSFFNTNRNIVQSDYKEDQWIAYYESAIEPTVVQMSNEFSRKLFSRRERGFGNKIIFESSNLSFASMQTKLQLSDFVDRGIMTPNEVRKVLNMAPIEGGDVAVRRLDTRPTSE